jgi:formylaminopyrimidine deformylase / aminopyrimidine aminohydrolase
VNTTDLLARHHAAWQSATRHPFLDSARDGTLAQSAFERWLRQDALFVAELLRFQARLLARAPRPDQAVLASGLVALDAELTWFEQHTRSRILSADVAPLPATLDYRAYLAQLDGGPYELAIVALWTIERAYLDAWLSAWPGAPAYREFVKHWTVPAFADYVERLQIAADAALARGAPEQAEHAFERIAALERAFWDMASATASR